MKRALAGPVLLLLGCGAPGSWDDLTGGVPLDERAPILLAPMSTSLVTSQKPTFKWELQDGTDGAVLELCRTRDCANVEHTQDVQGNTAVPDQPLDRGTWFWRMRARAGSRLARKPGVTWQFHVPNNQSAATSTVYGTVTDLDGDAKSDLVVGDPGAAGGNGAVYIYLTADGFQGGPSTTLRPPAGVTGFGRAVASAGDIDGDGVGDLVVGAVGHAYVYYEIDNAPFPMDGAGASFGAAVGSIGDLDGDGHGDVLVGEPDADTVHIRYGSDNGSLERNAQVTKATRGGQFGASTLGSCDFDGNGNPDALIGAPAPAPLYNAMGVIFGDHIDKDPLLLCAPSTSDVGFGRSVACADVNGDGFGDAFGGAPGAGDVWYALGASQLSSASPGQCPPPQGDVPTLPGAGDFGLAVANAGDLNADGIDDLLVASKTDVYVYLGTSASSGPSRGAAIQPPEFGGGLRALYEGAQGKMQIAIGGTGHVYIYETDGVNATKVIDIAAPPDADPAFGRVIN